MVVSFTTLTPDAGVLSNDTVVVPTSVKLLPVIVTKVPPAGGPLSGSIALTCGALWYVNPLKSVSDPLLLLTVTSASPAVLAGVVQLMVVSLITLTPDAGAPPKVTLVSGVVVK